MRSRQPIFMKKKRLLAVGLAFTVFATGFFVSFGTRILGTAAQTPPPLAISSVVVASVAPTQATITWTTNLASTSAVEYGTAAGVYTATQQATGSPPATFTSHSITVTGLTPGTTYHFRAISAITPSSEVARSGDRILTTPISTILGPSGGKADITSVNIVALAANQAQISFSYSSPTPPGSLRYDVLYGPTTAYQSSLPLTTLSAASGIFSLDNLSAATTYHFVIRLFGADPEPIAVTADRTFTTPTGSGDTSALIIERIRVDCVDRYCQVYFATSRSARVEVRWDTSSQGTFEAYADSVIEAGYSSAFRAVRIPSTSQPDLVKNTTYHYRLRASAEVGGSQFTTGDLTLVTSNSPADHIFGTGECIDPVSNTHVTIGTCFNKQFCTTDAVLVDDCTKCGFTCPVGNTCRTTASGGRCEVDPALKKDAPTQCNKSTCFSDSGTFVTPAAAGCFASWPRCNANTILKVRKDRGCNLWLTCATSFQSETSSAAPAQNICLSLAACNGLNTKGQCNNYLPPGQCNNDPLRFCNSDVDCRNGGTCNLPSNDNPTRSLQDLTYKTPEQVTEIANLSGNVIAGLDWHNQGGSAVIQGLLPWQLMRQIGAKAVFNNGDFEYYNPPKTSNFRIVPFPDSGDATMEVKFEDINNSVNHVLEVKPVTERTHGQCRTTKDAEGEPVLCNPDKEDVGSSPENNCAAGDTCELTTIPINYSGVATEQFSVSPNEYYFAEARVRAIGNATPRLRAQFGYDGYTKFTATTTVKLCRDHNTQTCNVDSDCPSGDICAAPQKVITNTYADFSADSAWQRVTIGPIRGMFNNARFAVVCADNSTCQDVSFQVDDIQVRPVLQVNTNPSYLTPSCRLYPKNDSPSCDYVDTNGVAYKGWRGYCLERDSQTGTCISWWPIDVIKGESDLFGAEQTAGYDGRVPLFLCAESRGGYYDLNSPQQISIYDTDYLQMLRSSISAFNTAGCKQWFFMNSCQPWWLRGSGVFFGWKGAQTYTVPVTEALDKTIKASELEYIQLNTSGSPRYIGPQPLTSSDCGAGPVGKPWTYCAKDPASAYYWGVTFNFNSTTQVLESITMFANFPQTWGSYQYVYPYFFRTEQCTKLVQVVGPNGENRAFSSRVNSGSYSVPNLGYRLSKDYTPFGGAVQPGSTSTIDPNDPATWGFALNAEEANKGTSIDFPIPYQSRAGTPYACQGKCPRFVCTTDRGNDCSTTTLIDTCHAKNYLADGTTVTQPDADGVVVRGRCIGLQTTSLASAGACTPTTKQCTEIKAVSAFGADAGAAKSAATALCTSSVACDGVTQLGCGTQILFKTYIEQSNVDTDPSVPAGEPRFLSTGICVPTSQPTSSVTNITGATVESATAAAQTACGAGKSISVTDTSCVDPVIDPAVTCSAVGTCSNDPAIFCSPATVAQDCPQAQCTGGTCSTNSAIACSSAGDCPSLCKLGQCASGSAACRSNSDCPTVPSGTCLDLDNDDTEPFYCSNDNSIACTSGTAEGGTSATCGSTATACNAGACRDRTTTACTTDTDCWLASNTCTGSFVCSNDNTKQCRSAADCNTDVCVAKNPAEYRVSGMCFVADSYSQGSGSSNAFQSPTQKGLQSFDNTHDPNDYSQIRKCVASSSICVGRDPIVHSDAGYTRGTSENAARWKCAEMLACEGRTASCGTMGTNVYYSYNSPIYEEHTRNGCTGRCRWDVWVKCKLGTPDNTVTYTSANTSNFSEDHIRRLFAQSYGIWTTYRCTNATSRSCSVDTDCPAGGRCTVSTGLYSQVNNSSFGSSAFYGWTPPKKVCPAQTVGGQCAVEPQLCSPSIFATVVGNGSTDDLAKNDALAKCKNIVACDGTKSICPSSGTKVKYSGISSSSTCVAATAPSTGRNCTVTCTIPSNLTYQQAGAVIVPAGQQPVRPQYYADDPAFSAISAEKGDYCAVPPSIFCPGNCAPNQYAAFLGSLSTTTTISGGSGNVGIRFGSRANADQLPLANIRIDWGDAQDSYAFPYAPHTDPKRPHIFNHVYVLNRGDTTHCKVVDNRMQCKYQIKIQIEDNWGWCNDYKKNASPLYTDPDVACHKDIEADGIHFKSSEWQDSGLTVIIQA